MRERVMRVALAGLAVSAVVVGAWAAFAPRSFYDDFPGGGRSWVAPDGPFNEHLVRDVGALNLGLVVVTAVALVTLTRTMVLATASAWLVYGVPHLVYHLRHLSPFDASDQVAMVASLTLAPAVALLLLELSRAGLGDAKLGASRAPGRSSPSITSASTDPMVR